MPIRLKESRTHLPLAAGIALLGLALILAGSLATPRASAETPPAAIEKI
ncbi:hypothetical protein [Hyphomonas sp.]